jgi:isochorismate synthase
MVAANSLQGVKLGMSASAREVATIDIHVRAFDPDRPADGYWHSLPRDLRWTPPHVYRESSRHAELLSQSKHASTPVRIGESSEIGQPELDTCREEWVDTAQTHLNAITRGELTKVVLARRRQVNKLVPFSSERILRRLRSRYASATIFAMRYGDQVFLGASPEMLGMVRSGRLETAAIAGTCWPDAPIDLRNDPKERHEHQVVVDHMRAALEPICDQIAVASEPDLLRLPNVEHLRTCFWGELIAGAGIGDVARRLHPTPAVAGMPTKAALLAIREAEHFDRGWFAGPIGWSDGSGDGEFAVAIRSALIVGSKATLFAGCGLVLGSEANREWEESQAKLEAMEWAITT